MELKVAEFLTGLIAYFLVYLVVVTLAGAFRAWVSHKMGDDTAADAGFMTLNPFVHVNPFAAVLLAAFGFVIGRYIPIDHRHIHTPFRRFKIIVAHLSSVFVYVMCALLGLIVLISGCGLGVLERAMYMLHGIVDIKHMYLAQSYPECSSLSLVTSFIAVVTTSVSILLAVLDFLFDMWFLIAQHIRQSFDIDEEYSILLFIIVPLIGIWFFHPLLSYIMTQIILVSGYGVALLLGIG